MQPGSGAGDDSPVRQTYSLEAIMALQKTLQDGIPEELIPDELETCSHSGDSRTDSSNGRTDCLEAVSALSGILGCASDIASRIRDFFAGRVRSRKKKMNGRHARKAA